MGNQSLYTETNLIRQNGTDLQIFFPQEVNTLSIEFVLKVALAKSYKNKGKTTFDLKYCTWVDPFALNIIALWMRDLINRKIGLIVLESPSNKQVKYFMQASGFNSYISQPTEDQPIRPSDISYVLSQYSPLRLFDNEAQFKEYLSYLKDDEVLTKIFFDVLNEDLIKKGKIRDVILAELGDNIFTHAKSDLGNILMSKDKPKNKMSAPSWKKNLINKASIFEKRFFNDLPEDGIIVISIADNGVGITKSLRDAYLLEKKINVVGDCDVLEFAFDKYSSSRSTSIRIAGNQTLEDKVDYNEIFKPTTGLFKVYSLVQKLRGLIYIRSGNAIFSINFLSEKDPVLLRSDNRTLKKNIGINPVSFPGTQIKIVIPDTTLAPINVRQYKLQIPETRNRSNRVLLSLSEYSGIFTGNNKSEQVTRLNELAADIRSYFNKRQYEGIILDVTLPEGTVLTQPKYVQYLVAVLVISQNENFTSVIVNAPTALNDLLKESFNNKDGYDYTPLVVFDADHQRSFLCVSDEEDNYIKTVLRTGQVTLESAESHLHLRKFAALFSTKDSTNPSLVHNRDNIYGLVKKSYESNLCDFIINPSNGIFIRDAKALLPSNVYCEGFFEVANLFSHPLANYWLKKWVEYILLVVKPKWIFSLNAQSNEFIDGIILQNQNNVLKRIKHIKIQKPLNLDYVELIQVCQEIDDQEPIVVFTDVVGTKKSITNLLDTLGAKNVTQVLTIVNATESKLDQISYFHKIVPLIEIFKYSLTFYSSKPTHWHYHEISFVNAKTNKLEQSILKLNEPIWNPFLERSFSNQNIINKILVDNGLIYRGRKVNFNKIHTFFWFDFKGLIQRYQSDFARTILVNLSAYVQSENNTIKLEGALVFHIREKPFVDEIINSLLGMTEIAFLPQSISLDVFYFGYVDSPMRLKGKILVFIEDVFTDSDSAFKLLDYCARNGVAAILMYYIIKLGDNLAFDRLKKIKVYSNVRVHIEFLVEVPLPVYSSPSPTDRIKQDLSEVLSKIPKQTSFKSIRQFIEEKTKSLQVEPAYIGSAQESSLANKGLVSAAVALHEAKDLTEVLSGIISTLDNRTTDALVYLELLGEEYWIDLDNSTSMRILKKQFALAIVESCKYFLTHESNRITLNQFFNLLFLLRQYDKSIIIQDFKMIYDQVKHSEDKSNILYMHLIQSISIENLTSTLIARSLRSLPAQLSEISNKEILHFLTELIFQSLEYKQSVEQGINISSDLMKIKQEFHSINRARDLFDASITQLQFDNFGEIMTDLYKSFHRINRYLNNISSKTFKFDDYNTELRSNQNLLSRFASELKDLADPNINHNDVVDQLKMLSNQIQYYFTSNEKRNFQQLANALIQEITVVASNRINTYYKSLFVVHGIELITNRTIVNKFHVFAEKDGLLKIIDNAVNNAVSHSKATLFYYDICTDGEFVLLKLFDNGLSIENALNNSSVFQNKGLGIIEELISLYDGEFTYKVLSETFEGHTFTNVNQFKFKFLDLDK